MPVGGVPHKISKEIIMFYILQDITGAGITYSRVGHPHTSRSAAAKAANKLSAKGGQPLRVVSATQYIEILETNQRLFGA